MDSEILSPPNGMSCANKPAKSSGPVEFHQKVRRAHESLHDQHMLMPEGAAMRTQVLMPFMPLHLHWIQSPCPPPCDCNPPLNTPCT